MLFSFQFLLANTEEFYTAAVLEFTPPGALLSAPQEIVESNLKEYLVTIDEASTHGVDILVFPEATLNYNKITSRESLAEYAVELKSPVSENYCDYSDSNVSNLGLLMTVF